MTLGHHDIIKELLSRGTYAFPPEPSMRLIADMIAFTVDEVPRWNPIIICSYHLQEAGATPVQAWLGKECKAPTRARVRATVGLPSRRVRLLWP